MMEPTKDNKVYWLLCFLCVAVIAYIFAITFLGIPKENVRFADTALGFFLGSVLGNILSYYVGGSPSLKKTDPPAGTTTADISATITTSKKDQEPASE